MMLVIFNGADACFAALRLHAHTFAAINRRADNILILKKLLPLLFFGLEHFSQHTKFYLINFH